MQWITRISTRLRFLDRLQGSETGVLVAVAIVIGAGTGLGAVGFIKLIALVQQFFFQDGAKYLSGLGRTLIIIVPMVGGLLAGPIISFFAHEAKGHGVPEVMQALALRGGRIRPRVVVAKIAASALCIGTGGSAGREGPIVQVGAALGSTIGQWLKFSPSRIRNLVACGAAAGIAATFNAPIAGVIFSMEIILGELHLGDLGNVVISAVTASTLARMFLGERPAFTVPNYAMQSPWEIFLYVMLGVLSAVVAVGFIRILYWFEDRFDEWNFPDALKPAVGGLLLGLTAYFYPTILGLGFVTTESHLFGLSFNIPAVFGSGFPVIESSLLGQVPWALLLALVFLKPLATSLTLGSGNSGGVFAPGLFTGAALGGVFGFAVNAIFPGAVAAPGAFATVGMAAVFAGAARAPFTAILIVFEMTDDYQLIIPLMAAVIVSQIVAERLFKDSIYTLKLTRRGIHLKRGRDVDVMENITVGEVMRPAPEPLPGFMLLRDVPPLLDAKRMHGLPVADRHGNLCGVITIQDVDAAIHKDQANLDAPVMSFCSQHLVVAYPEETVNQALERMSHRDIGRLPVVNPGEMHKLVGWINRGDIIRAYERAMTRRVAIENQLTRARLGDISGVNVYEHIVEAKSTADGHLLSEVPWPSESLVASIQRGRTLLIPHGGTRLQAGDQLTVVAMPRDENELAKLMKKVEITKEGENASSG